MRRGSHGSLAARLPKAAKTEDQLGLGPGPKSKIRDGSHERMERPLVTAVFDFRFRAPYEPQLILESIRFTRPDPLNSKLPRDSRGPPVRPATVHGPRSTSPRVRKLLVVTSASHPRTQHTASAHARACRLSRLTRAPSDAPSQPSRAPSPPDL